MRREASRDSRSVAAQGSQALRLSLPLTGCRIQAPLASLLLANQLVEFSPRPRAERTRIRVVHYRVSRTPLHAPSVGRVARTSGLCLLLRSRRATHSFSVAPLGEATRSKVGDASRVCQRRVLGWGLG
jgi:hypothetical protein